MIKGIKDGITVGISLSDKEWEKLSGQRVAIQKAVDNSTLRFP